LQIDAPINRGNSGGPTFNLQGEVIGINTAIFSPSGGSVGIGFAIPSDFARLIIDQIRSTGGVERGWLGVSIQSINPALAKAFGADPEKPLGALVDDVEQGSPAAKAGIKRGDMIIKINGKEVTSAHDLPRIVAITKPGQQLDITLLRDGKDEQATATVASMPTPAQLADASASEGSSSAKEPQVGTLGIAFQPLTAELRGQFHARAATKGVVVQGVLPGSPGAQLGLQPGDIVESVNREQLDSPQDAESKIEKAAQSGTIVLFVDRDGSGQYIGVSKE
jgi:serine protease Do